MKLKHKTETHEKEGSILKIVWIILKEILTKTLVIKTALMENKLCILKDKTKNIKIRKLGCY